MTELKSGVHCQLQLLMEGNMGGGGGVGALNTATPQKKSNEHRIAARKVNETSSLQHLFLAPWFVHLHALKGTVSQTAHAQLIIQKWSDVFKFVICETNWRRQAEDRILTVMEAVETTLAVRRF